MTKREARRDTKGGDTGVREAELGEKWERARCGVGQNGGREMRKAEDRESWEKSNRD